MWVVDDANDQFPIAFDHFGYEKRNVAICTCGERHQLATGLLGFAGIGDIEPYETTFGLVGDVVSGKFDDYGISNVVGRLDCLCSSGTDRLLGKWNTKRNKQLLGGCFGESCLVSHRVKH